MLISRQLWRETYRWLVVAAGAVVIVRAVVEQARIGFEFNLFLLAGLTALVAATISIRITRHNGAITVADTFIFLALLLWNAPAAILIGVTESLASSWKTNCVLRSYLFNISLTAVSVYATASALEYLFGTPSLLVNLSIPNFSLAVVTMGLTYYFVLMTLIAVIQALRTESWENWRAWMRQYYLWSCVTFLVAAAAAGVIVKVIGSVSWIAIVAVLPIVFLLYLTYRTYLRNLDALQESEARFRSSFDYATVGMALVSPEGRWLESNPSLRELLGRGETELTKLRYQDAILSEDAEQVETSIAALLANDAPTFQNEVRFVRADGEIVWTLLSASTARDAQDQTRHLIFQIQDISQRKKAVEQLFYKASHDGLTGLYNRAAYSTRLQDAITRSKRFQERAFAVLFLDLDGFKRVNDSLGHAVGDELLKATAKRLLGCIREVDTVARFGGDEFTILLEDLDSTKKAIDIAERVKRDLSQPFEFDGQEVFIGTSIGIATSEIEYQTSDEIIRDADAAMYQAKSRGKGCHVLFDSEMHQKAMRQLRLASDMRRAAERGEFSLQYQTITSLEENKIHGFEVFTRWQHPVYGLLMPSEFIPLAEDNNLTGEIDRWALVTACRQLRQWQKENADFDDCVISVNISTKQFAQSGLYEFVAQTLGETGLNAKCLQLEITESAMAQNLTNTAQILQRLSDLGVSVALDDFGTGYSSLSYLHELPICTLKIDRSFVNRLGTDQDGAAIVRAIIVLAKNLRIEVVAEGVETADQLELLRAMNCDFGQGYLFSRPASAPDTFESYNKSSVTIAPLSDHEFCQSTSTQNV